MEHLLACMKIAGDDTVQRTQLRHRQELVKAFQIEPGMRVLEIGCGQGDTTVVLADRVGEQGHVHAIDIAEADYGAPFTLGEATETILKSKLGSRITFQLETDVMDLTFDEPYDVAVLSHCSWYFRSPAQLTDYLQKLRTAAKRICLAEWDAAYIKDSQRAHFYSAAILALYSEYVENDGNIQHMFAPSQLTQMLKDTGWQLSSKQTIDASYLQDGSWETDYALSIREKFSGAPERIQTLVSTFYYLLDTVKEDKTESLNSFVLTAVSGKE